MSIPIDALTEPRSFLIYGLCAVIVALWTWVKVERSERDKEGRQSASDLLECRVSGERSLARIDYREEQASDLRRQLERCETGRDACHDRERAWWQGEKGGR